MSNETLASEVVSDIIPRAALPQGLKRVGDDLISGMSEPSDSAIAQHDEKQGEARAAAEESGRQAAGKTDRHGNAFDSSQHQVDENGSPKLTKSGKLRLLTNRPKGARRESKISTPAVAGANPEAEKRLAARATGVAAANTIIMLGVTVGGEEWLPISNEEHGIDERSNLEKAFGDYFEATGQTDFPPGVALSICLVAYAAPRFTMPKTQKRARGFGYWLREKWIARKKKREHKTGKVQEISEARDAKKDS